MNCTKAIIMAAGFGTRRLPITKAIEKGMLPIGNRPLMDYIVDDCIAAGITDIIFVVGEQSDQLQTYYGHNQLLSEYLRRRGKSAELDQVEQLARKATFHYVVQDQHQPYGTATPAWLCHNLVERGEQVILLSGDQFLYNADGSSEIASFLAAAEAAGAHSALLAGKVAHEDVSKYGVIKSVERDGHLLYDSIVEKPTPADAPSDLINLTCYLLDGSFFPYANPDFLNPFHGEYLITDAINDYVADGNDIFVFRAEGEYLDCGSLEGWLHANNRVLG